MIIETDRLKTGELMVSFQSEGPQVQNLGRADVSVPVQRQDKSDVPSQKQSGWRNILLLRTGSAFLFYSDLQLIG